jgi:hypothetical protein
MILCLFPRLPHQLMLTRTFWSLLSGDPQASLVEGDFHQEVAAESWAIPWA